MRKLHPLITVAALGALALLYLPLGSVAAYSFNRARRGLVWEGFTFEWYTALFRNAKVLQLAQNTLTLALVSTAIATVLGTLLALGLDRHPWPRRARGAMDLLAHLPVVTPDIILAAALLVALGILQHVSRLFEPGLPAMVLGHVTFQIPFVALVVRSRLATLGAAPDEAARDLYASTPRLLWKVTLPLLLPGIVAGAMLAFTLSLDDFVISFFTYGVSSETLPIRIQAELRKGITGEINALSTLIFVATAVLVIGSERLMHKQRE